jgi:hypothetical protein
VEAKPYPPDAGGVRHDDRIPGFNEVVRQDVDFLPGPEEVLVEADDLFDAPVL